MGKRKLLVAVIVALCFSLLGMATLASATPAQQNGLHEYEESEVLFAAHIAQSADTPRQYVVSFDPRPGVFPEGEDGVRTGASGFVINSFTNTPTREGYTFGGWHIGGDEVTFPITVTGNMTLFVVWHSAGEAVTATPTATATPNTTVAPTVAPVIDQRSNPQTSGFGILNIVGIVVLTGVSLCIVKMVGKKGTRPN